MTAVLIAPDSSVAPRPVSKRSQALLALHRLTVVLTLGGVTGVYVLFVWTTLLYQEWPHRPGDHRFSSCPKAASFMDPGEWCGGTFDPKGYSPLYELVLVLIMALPFAAIAWLPASLALKGLTRERQRTWNIAFAIGVACIALTVAFDPVGAMAWFAD